MLKSLKRIVQEVTTCRRLDEACSILVRHLHKVLVADAASIFLIDHKHSQYVLIATEGLNPEAAFRFRIGLKKGLIGLIGQREEPVNMDDATTHPRYHQDSLLQEENLDAFLGVPIIQHRKLFGVITVQRTENRCFDNLEESFLITLAAQIGGMLSQAESTGELDELTKPKPTGLARTENHEVAYSGVGCVPGVGIGTAIVVYPPADIDAVPMRVVDDPTHEATLFFDALFKVRDDIAQLSHRLKSSVDEKELALFDVYLSLLDKQGLGVEVEHVILTEKLNAQSALALVIKNHIQQFENMKDDYLKERASDFRDLGRRILAELQSAQMQDIQYPARTILVGEEVSASDLAEVPEGLLMGVVAAKGSANSHVSILARAMGVPTVMGVKGLNFEQISRRAMVVDGYYGHVFISPSKALLAEYKKLALEEAELNQSLVGLRDKPAETLDNVKIGLFVNTGIALDAGLSMSVGAEGVGLYRSEMPFMARERFPSEEEQFIIYRQTLKAFAPRWVTMRTLDIGGDKVPSYFPIEEANPYLGWRGIRVTLDHPDLFLLQVRAMMRANEALNNLRIMLPMVTTLSEVDEALYLINQAYKELIEEGYQIEKPKIGLMIEVPAAAFQAREFAKRVDFISVGSNDLTQYLLAVDRNNARVASLYDALHPAMLKILMKIVDGGHAAGVEVGICGEMASDPLSVILLMAMGFDSLSMNSFSLPRIKWVIRNFSIAHVRKILGEVLEYENADNIRLYLQKALTDQGLGGLIRAGKT